MFNYLNDIDILSIILIFFGLSILPCVAYIKKDFIKPKKTLKGKKVFLKTIRVKR